MDPVSLVVAILVVSPCIAVYFVFIKGADRYEPEPLWLLLLLMAWGAFGATVPSMGANLLGENAIRMALHAGQQDALVDASTATFVAPLVEETAKGLGLLLLWLVSARWLKELDGPLDGAIFGGMVGLGFTLTEDVFYLATTLAEQGMEAFGALFVVRTLLAGLGHATFTAMTGLGIGLAVEARSCLARVVLPAAGWIAAVVLHGLHNLLVTFLWGEGLGLLAKLLLFWFVDLLFFVLILGLVLRDRTIIFRGLADEVGSLLTRNELRRTVSPWMLLPLWNLLDLASAPAGYRRSRAKQLALIKLAFVKQRLQRGEQGLESREQRLRADIAGATMDGVLLA